MQPEQYYSLRNKYLWNLLASLHSVQVPVCQNITRGLLHSSRLSKEFQFSPAKVKANCYLTAAGLAQLVERLTAE